MERNKQVRQKQSPLKRKWFDKQFENPNKYGDKQDSSNKRVGKPAMMDHVKFLPPKADKIVNVRQRCGQYTEKKKIPVTPWPADRLRTNRACCNMGKNIHDTSSVMKHLK